MKLAYFSIVLFCCAVCQGQIPAVQWKKCYGGTKSDALESIIHTPDGGYIMIGSTMSGDGDVAPLHGAAGDRDIWVVKISDSGVIEWQNTYGGTQQDFGNHIIPTSDGGYIMAGRTYSNDGDATIGWGGLDAWIIKMDVTGSIQWQKKYGSSGPDAAYHISQTSDGGYIFSGYAGASGGQVTNFKGVRDAWVVKTDSQGNLQWQKSIGGNMEDYAFKVFPVSNGYIVGAETISSSGDVTTNHGGTDLWVINLNGDGAVIWQQCYGGPARQELSDIAPTSDGGYILAGNTANDGGMVTGYHPPGTGNFGIKDDFWVVKITANGALQWQKCYGGSDNEVAKKILQTPEGGYIITGYSDSNNGDNDSFFTFNKWDYWTIKTDVSGNIQWQETHGGTNDDAPIDLIITTDNGYLIAGFSNSVDQHVTDNHGENDFFLVKLFPDFLALESNHFKPTVIYPNPATNFIQVEDETTDIVHLYNLYGAKILSGKPGRIDVSNLSAGTYIIKGEQAGKTVFVKKIIRE